MHVNVKLYLSRFLLFHERFFYEMNIFFAVTNYKSHKRINKLDLQMEIGKRLTYKKMYKFSCYTYTTLKNKIKN